MKRIFTILVSIIFSIPAAALTVESVKIRNPGGFVDVTASYVGCMKVPFDITMPECTFETGHTLTKCYSDLSLAEDPGACGRIIKNTSTFTLRELGINSVHDYALIHVSGDDGSIADDSVRVFLHSTPIKLVDAQVNNDSLTLTYQYPGCQEVEPSFDITACDTAREEGRWCRAEVFVATDPGDCAQKITSVHTWSITRDLEFDQPTDRDVELTMNGNDGSKVKVRLPK
jgi:hypothetical protein